MKLKKSVKKLIIVIIVMLLAGVAAYLGFKSLNSNKAKEVKDRKSTRLNSSHL